jgi:hypothetical protein
MLFFWKVLSVMKGIREILVEALLMGSWWPLWWREY